MQVQIDEFLNWLSLADTTKKSYRFALTAFQMSGVKIGVDAMREFDAWMKREREYSRDTSSLYLIVLKRYLGWLSVIGKAEAGIETLARARMIAARPRANHVGGRNVRRPGDGMEHAITFYDDEALPEDRADYLALLRNRAFMHLMWDTGGRVSEVLSITRKAFETAEGARVRIKGKGSVDRWIFMTPVSMRYVEQYLMARGADRYPMLFVSHHRGSGLPINRVTAWRIVKRAARAVGVKGNCGPHMIRHARAEQLVNEGMPIEAVQRFLGHTNVSTTVTYYAKLREDRVEQYLQEYGLQPSARTNAKRN